MSELLNFNPSGDKDLGCTSGDDLDSDESDAEFCDYDDADQRTWETAFVDEEGAEHLQEDELEPFTCTLDAVAITSHLKRPVAIAQTESDTSSGPVDLDFTERYHP